MALTLAAVYAAIGFMAGTTGKLFTEFAWTLAGAVIVSGFVALTLSPMMLLEAPSTAAKTTVRSTASWRRACVSYHPVPCPARGTGSAHMVLLMGLPWRISYFLFRRWSRSSHPTEDQGFLVGIIQAPEGATIERTDTYAKKLVEIFAKVPEADAISWFPAAHGLARNDLLKLSRGASGSGVSRNRYGHHSRWWAQSRVVAFPAVHPTWTGVRDKPICERPMTIAGHRRQDAGQGRRRSWPR